MIVFELQFRADITCHKSFMLFVFYYDSVTCNKSSVCIIVEPQYDKPCYVLGQKSHLCKFDMNTKNALLYWLCIYH